MPSLPEWASEADWHWMQRALTLAEQAEQEGEVPVGAVLVDAQQNEVAAGWNRVIQQNDPTAHAEIVALRAAGSVLQNYRLPDLTLYVTLEPCPMCAAAMVHARIRRLVIATTDPRTGAAGSAMDLVAHPCLNHRIATDIGLCQSQASDQLKAFFRAKRR